MTPKRQPDAHCRHCNGRGYVRTHGRFVACICTRATASDIALSRAVNQVGGRRRRTLTEMLSEGDQSQLGGQP